MKITKDYPGLKRNASNYYVIDGDLISEEGIEIELDDQLAVTGRIEAGEGIKAGCGIKAGWGIEAKVIDCKLRIFAGISLYQSSRNCVKTICCEELLAGEVCYGDLILKKNKEE